MSRDGLQAHPTAVAGQVRVRHSRTHTISNFIQSIMKPFPSIYAATALICGFPVFIHAQEDPRILPPLVVQGRSVSQPWSLNESIVGADHLRSADSAALIRNLPGAAVVRNGPQTGIVQLRGLSGDRVAVRVDGMTITPACPNHMDPPLHYALAGRGDLIDMYAGISPVSVGGDHIGGSLNFSRPDPVFADGAASLFQGSLGTSFSGSQDATMATADLTFSQGDAAFQYRAPARPPEISAIRAARWLTADTTRPTMKSSARGGQKEASSPSMPGFPPPAMRAHPRCRWT